MTTSTWARHVRAWLCAGVACVAMPAWSEGNAPSTADANAASWAAARKVAKDGPQDVALAGQAVIKLPQGTVFVPQPEANRLLVAMGNPGQDPKLHGLIFPADDGGWFMTVRYEDSGYIKDGDAKEWNAAELLDSYKQGTEAQNPERIKMGVAPLEILGWAETPTYQPDSHRLVWAMNMRDKGQTNDAEQVVNYNTYLLGREGYFSMNLVTGLTQLPAHKPQAQALLGALNFNEGKRYLDFNASTDHVAEYGLAALVLGVGAKKLGLLAMAGVFLAKFAKLGVLALFGGVAAARKLWGGKGKNAGADSPPSA
jgi:uncharacterized membrane-anchored protein